MGNGKAREVERRTEAQREELAIDVVARRVLWHVAETLGYHPAKWVPAKEDYPDLSSDQWNRVVAQAMVFAREQNPSEADFASCYEYLTGEQP